MATRTVRFILLVLLLGTARYGRAQADRAARVEALLGSMTLEEKVGQMTQLTLQAVSATRGTADTPHTLDMDKLRQALVEYHVGSLLNVYDVSFPLAYWRDLITTIQDVATKETRLGIPVLYGIDAVHGHHYLREGTLFPQNVAMAATWNPDLVRRSNAITAVEVRASGIPWNFSPVFDVGRQPLWSRFFETFGEDPYLVSVMGRASVEGQQAGALGAPDRVAACAKHYVGYSMPLSGKDRSPAWIPERLLREFFLPPFAAAVEAGVASVMVNSGDVNGEPVHASHYLLTEVLRGELGFEGVAVSDWEDIKKLHTVHRVAATEKEAVRMAVLAGVDMSMVPLSLDFHDDLVALVREGAVPEARIDEAVRRILNLKFALGLFEQPYPDPALSAKVGAPEHRAVSLQAAQEAVTLLKNEGGLLPLSKQARVLVTGPGAASLPVLHGAWTYTWQGTDEALYPEDTPTFLEAVQAEVGAAQVTYVPGTRLYDEVDIPAAVAAARQADVALVVAAEKASVEQVGSIEDLRLPAVQTRLVRAVAATGTPVVLVLLENRPRIVREAVAQARAVVLGYEPGMRGGEALADVLFGDVNPSGHLPFTYPRHTGALVHYDHKFAQEQDTTFGWTGYNPQWDFGFGLSYTTFAYGNLTLDKPLMGADDTLAVSVTVTNTGDRAGKEVVQLYVRDLYARIAPRVKRLRGFEKVTLAPGEARTVTFRLDRDDLSYIGLHNRPVLEPGDFEVYVGGLKAGFAVR